MRQNTAPVPSLNPETIIVVTALLQTDAEQHAEEYEFAYVSHFLKFQAF
jgi:hypothetical protein